MVKDESIHETSARYLVLRIIEDGELFRSHFISQNYMAQEKWRSGRDSNPRPPA